MPVVHLEAQRELGEQRGRIATDRNQAYGSIFDAGDTHDLRIAGGQSQSIDLGAASARRAYVIASCDSNCEDINLQVFDSQGSALGTDDKYGTQPAVEIDAEGAGTLSAKVTMASCNAESCAVAVQVISLDEPIGTGTCFAVSPDGLLLTANHVIEGMTSIAVRFGDGKESSAYVVRRSPDNDLALIRVASKPPDWLGIAPATKATIGHAVFTVGYPAPELLGDEPKYTEGVISSLSGHDNEATMLQITVPVQGGNSGGPLVDFDGEVLGVVVAGISSDALGYEPQLVTYARYAQIARLLAKPNEGFPLKPVARSKAEAIARAMKAVCYVSGR